MALLIRNIFAERAVFRSQDLFQGESFKLLPTAHGEPEAVSDAIGYAQLLR